MTTFSENYTIAPVELASDPEIFESFLEGQRAALLNFGVSDRAIAVDRSLPAPGNYALVARKPEGDLLAGIRVFSRASERKLPVEADSSPLPAHLRRRIAAEPGLCELGSLWVAPYYSGRFLSRRMVALGTVLAYERGFSSVVSFSHSRTFRFLLGPLGFEQDAEMPILAYPDERFESFVSWHRGGLAAVQARLRSDGYAPGLEPSLSPELVP